MSNTCNCIRVATEYELELTREVVTLPIKMFGNILRNSIPCISNITSTGFSRTFCTTQSLCEIRKLARMRVVDNSAIGRAAAAAGRPARVIQVYNQKQVGMIESSFQSGVITVLADLIH
ncbi:ribosomal L14, mitochondrial [Octopus vulgaris]|uniref:Ribosomal L14, mitochondrial n=1 Tax=Octopus vulgaris TaxID=6645 RepID=A0AA36F9Z8_OCTVU|nr:ribosomal L14, mitochondrial [Octopus vulgaris]